MACISNTRRAEILARIEKLEEQLSTANDTLDSALSTEVQEYRFDSGEGSQRVQYRNIDDIRKNIDWIESRIDYYRRKLNGTGLVNMNLRRKNYHSYRSLRTW